jgi:hypothetical protein
MRVTGGYMKSSRNLISMRSTRIDAVAEMEEARRLGDVDQLELDWRVIGSAEERQAVAQQHRAHF